MNTAVWVEISRARLRRHPSGQLDETEVAIDVRTLQRLHSEGACPLQQHPCALEPPAEPGVFGGSGEQPGALAFVWVSAAARSYASEAATKPLRRRAHGRLLELFHHRRVGPHARCRPCHARRSASASPSSTLASARWAA
jgi:hypothetical protein